MSHRIILKNKDHKLEKKKHQEPQLKNIREQESDTNFLIFYWGGEHVFYRTNEGN